MQQIFPGNRPTIRFRVFSTLGVILIGLGGVRSVRGEFVNVGDGNFASSTSNGSVGGVISAGPTTQEIGSGPWFGTFNGLKIGSFSFLAPTLTVGSAGATVSNVIAAGGLENGGYFSQTLATSYRPLTTYLLTADITTGSLLGASLLGNTGVGIGLTDGSGTFLASTTTSPTLISVSLLSGTTYQVELSYTTGATSPGLIGVRLFDAPSGIANVNLLSSVTFNNISLAASVPEPTSVALLGFGLASSTLIISRRRSLPRA